MIKHLILWKLKEEIEETKVEQIKKEMKESLEALKGEIEGLVDLKVQTKVLESSNVDVMLESLFESEEALKYYASHPAHVKVADEKVRPYTSGRFCIDFEV